MPRVSIVLPFRDAADTLPECLESIRRQTLAEWELVAVDDGSRDASAPLLEEFAREDARVRLLRPGRVGLVAALNLGVREAGAPLVARMDADDVMHPERLEAQAEYLDRHPDVALAGTQVELFPPERVQAGYREYVRWQNAVLEPDEVATQIYVESPFAHPSVMVRRETLLRVGGYAEGDFPEDYELWLRMHRAGCRMAKVPRVLLFWREREDRTSRVDARYARAAFDRLRAEYLARDPRLRGGREVVVWGAGRKTRLRARLLLERGVRPSAWVDIDPRKVGGTADGLPVRPPEWLAREPRPLVLVYVTSHGARDYVAGRLAEWGYRPGEDFLAVG